MLPLAKAIGVCPSLTSVTFRAVQFTSPALMLLINALSNAPVVHSVEISFCAPPIEDPSPIPLSAMQALTVQLPALASLQDAGADGKDRRTDRTAGRAVRNPKLSAPRDASPTISLPVSPGYSTLAHLRNLSALNIRCNNIDDEDAAPLLRNVSASPSLRVLSMWGNRLTDASAANIAALLRSNTSLVALDIGSNAFTDTAAATILLAFVPAVATGAAFHRLRLLARRAAASAAPPEPPSASLSSLADLDAVASDTGAGVAAATKRRRGRTAAAPGPGGGPDRVQVSGIYERECVALAEVDPAADATVAESREPFAIVPPNRTLRSLGMGQCLLSPRAAHLAMAVVLAVTPATLACGYIAGAAGSAGARDRVDGAPAAPAAAAPAAHRAAGAETEATRTAAAARAAAVSTALAALQGGMRASPELTQLAPLLVADSEAGISFDPAAAAGWLRHAAPSRATIGLQRSVDAPCVCNLQCNSSPSCMWSLSSLCSPTPGSSCRTLRLTRSPSPRRTTVPPRCKLRSTRLLLRGRD